ncbi:cystine transport system ATP-binding protein [Herbaspirillum sp. Sphag1AN]|uniref:amino acid ABC transporter ATP-binding protein n=1 Tax=unclassified Herbaspirillum TaxID=2624150 RepID=UPI00160963D2|nr:MULTISPECIES: amino acid ABC transporter ATP-binding protein [unclassified Herbaspirillum]MBB3213084.1 cystine transport system ATP-binding protein [Herbaspirillum sp. Sphag1AN]MBB3246281.1 cystine transport system ATP-binding protein [Herbaspirillum sp. Sphag64]
MNNSSPCTVRVRGLAKAFGPNKVLKHVDLTVGKGEVVVIMGPSGSGKTTFIRSLNFLEMPDQGSIEICGIELDEPLTLRPGEVRKKIFQIRQKTAMVFQSFNLFPHRTALQNVIEGLISVKGFDKEKAQQRGMLLLQKVGLSEKADAYPGKLSGGQKQRVAIARALAMEPEVILFDEPTSALDPELRDEVLGVMRDLAKEGITMLVVTHETRFARDVADRIVFMEGGHVIEDTTPSHFFGPTVSERCKQFLGRIHE